LSSSEAVSPAAISSFFEICDTDSEGKRLTDPSRIGARGGGFALKQGISTRVTVKRASKTTIKIRINAMLAPEAHTTLWALERLLQKSGSMFDVRVDLRVKVPIGSGFGTSAAGTAASCLALADAAQIPISMNEIGKLTHVAEVVNYTGLGTAFPVLTGGFVLVTEPGPPGIGLVDRLVFPKDHSIVCVYLGSIPTREALSQSDLAARVNPPARRALQSIREEPNLATFLSEVRRFAETAGFQTPEIAQLVKTVQAAGVVGVGQNMIGKAVHAVAEDSKVPRVIRHVRKAFPTARVFVSQLDDRGVRLSSS
jgi:pantoate kinase